MIRPVLSTLLLASWCSAQEMIWERVGIPGELQFGASSFLLDDVDGDGYQDWGHTAIRRRNLLEVHVLSGRDGHTMRVYGPGLSGFARAVGDWNGDGIRDWATAYSQSPGQLSVRVLSGRDDTVLMEIPSPLPGFTQWGVDLVGDLDLNGDGTPDLLVGASRSGFGEIYAYDNAGNLLYVFPGHFWKLGNLHGDLDEDACGDFVSGRASPDMSKGEVRVHSGRTGAVITAGTGDPGDGLGVSVVTGCGDVTGDGLPDFVGTSDGALVPGLVAVFAGTRAPAARPFRTWRRPPGGFGISLDARDLDGDGLQDLLVGSLELSGSLRGKMHWLSMRAGKQVRVFLPQTVPPDSSGFGYWIVTGSPQPGDVSPVFLAGEPGFGPNNHGRVALYRVMPAVVSGLGEGCAAPSGHTPRLGFTPWASVDRTDIHLADAPPGVPALLALGTSSTQWAGVSLPWSLAGAPFALPGCSLRTSIDVVVGVITGTHGNESGYASVTIATPVAMGTSGLTVHGQWLVLDATGTQLAATSNALTWAH